MIRVIALSLSTLGSASAFGKPCPHGKPSASAGWVSDGPLRDSTLSARGPGRVPTMETVNMDLAPKERWTAIGKKYASEAYLIVDYLRDQIPAWAFPILEEVGKKLDTYKGFGDYGDEMIGLATSLNISLGDVVMANLVYQLESIGINCSNWNNTGPTGQCKHDDHDGDGIVWLSEWREQRDAQRGVVRSPGPPSWAMCTSVVAQDPSGEVWHGRNLDWNLPSVLRKFIIDVTFTKGGKKYMTGTGLVGFVGLMNAIRPPGADGASGGFSFSIDARCQGGKILSNLIEMLLAGAATPAQHGRRSVDESASFEAAVAALSDGSLVDEIYYVVAGAAKWEGAVIARSRAKTEDVWRLDETAPSGATGQAAGWYRLETNYDRDIPVPSADDRRTPGYAHMDALTSKGVDASSIYDIMLQWPTFNPHTDYTGVFSPKLGYYNSTVW